MRYCQRRSVSPAGDDSSGKNLRDSVARELDGWAVATRVRVVETLMGEGHVAEAPRDPEVAPSDDPDPDSP
jgi:hypothetical protein